MLCDRIIERNGMSVHLADIHDGIISPESYCRKYGPFTGVVSSTINTQIRKESITYRTSKRLAQIGSKVKYHDDDEEKNDLSHESCSSYEMKDESEEDSDSADSHTNSKSKPNSKGNSRSHHSKKVVSTVSKEKFPESDYEFGTDPCIETKRKTNQSKRRKAMISRLSGTHLDDHYYPDEEDEVYERMLLLAKVQQNSSKMQHLGNKIPFSIKQKMDQGFIMHGSDAVFQAKTAPDKINAFQILLRLM